MDFAKLLREGAGEIDVRLTPMHLDAFGTYFSELLKWNRKVNLTAIVDPAEIIVKHFLDSLSLCRLLPEDVFSAADIGSGAGFPGLAIKVVRPDMDLSLVEPARKKAAFLRHIARLLKLPSVRVLDAKVEALGPEHSGLYDIVFSRAFKEPAQLLLLVAPLLTEEGRVALSLGPETNPEPPPGWKLLTKEEITLPFSDYRRRLVVYAKR